MRRGSKAVQKRCVSFGLLAPLGLIYKTHEFSNREELSLGQAYYLNTVRIPR